VTGVAEPWNAQLQSLGEFIRRRRKLANLSLRQLAERTTLSNPYLSQIERGLHQPSVRVLKLLAGALNVSAETLLTQAGLLDGTPPERSPVQDAISADGRLSEEQKSALLAVYRSMVQDQ
jgi:transcriptional regulator with XRE-family HTH domain